MLLVHGAGPYLAVVSIACLGACAQVAGGPASPTPAAIVANAASKPEPVNGRCVATASSGWTFACIVYTVPIGKRLVVETISYQLVGGAAHHPYRVIFGQGNAFVRLQPDIDQNIVILSPGVGVDADIYYKVWTDTRSIRLYLDEGQTLQGQGDFNDGTVFAPNVFTFSGHLISK